MIIVKKLKMMNIGMVATVILFLFYQAILKMTSAWKKQQLVIRPP